MPETELQNYESEVELALYREYRDVAPRFRHVVETDRRFYLANEVDIKVHTGQQGEVFFEVTLHDAWVWDVYRSDRFAARVRVLTFKDVNVEDHADGEPPRRGK